MIAGKSQIALNCRKLMEFELKGKERKDVFADIEKHLMLLNLRVVANDFNRPWGGFFVIDESQAKQFAELFFPGVEVTSLHISGKLSLKILIVEPGKRLSWQFHHRRAEMWLCRNIACSSGLRSDALAS